MLRLTLLTFLFMMWSITTAEAQTITFRTDPVPAGMTIEAVDSMLLDLDYTVAKVTDDVTFYAPYKKRKAFRRTILDLTDDRVSKYQLRFSEAFESRDWPAQESAVLRPPVTEAAYVVTLTGRHDPSAMERRAVEDHRMVLIPEGTVMRADGKAMGPAEEAYLRDESFEGMEFMIGRLLEGRTVTIGQTVSVPNNALSALETSFMRGDVLPEDLQLTLTEIERSDDGRIGKFKVTMRLEGTAGDIKLGTDIKGFLRIGENGWMHSLVLYGTVLGSGTYEATAVSADGTVEGTMTRTYISK